MKRQIYFLCATIAIAAPASGQTKYVVYFKGKASGTAVLHRKVNADKTLLTDFQVLLSDKGSTVKQVVRELRAKDGSVKAYATKTVGTKPDFMTADEIEITKKGVTAKQILDRKPWHGVGAKQFQGLSHFSPAPGPTKAASASWFYETKPKPGAHETFFAFNLSSEWHAVTVTYVGDQSVTIDGKPMRAHKVTLTSKRETATRYFGDGRLLKMTQGDFVYEAVLKSTKK